MHLCISVAFRLYDLRKTGFIEREEVSLMRKSLLYLGILKYLFAPTLYFQVMQMVKAILSESGLALSNDLLESILDKVNGFCIFNLNCVFLCLKLTTALIELNALKCEGSYSL